VTAYQIAEIRPQVSGIITERMFEEGSQVEEGQQLYQIDPAPYQARYNSAMADLKKAQANVKSVKAKEQRYQQLVKIEAVSQQEYDDLKAQLAQAEADIAIAQAAVETAKIDLNYTRVYAPISGRIGKSSVTKGALVTAQQETLLATVTQLDPIYVDMTQASADVLRLQQQAGSLDTIPVTLATDGVAYAQTGSLQFSEVTVDPTTDSVQLRALFPNPDGMLLPGLFVRAKLEMHHQGALLVPQNAAMRDPGGVLYVWTVGPQGTAQKTVVQAEQAVEGQWLISEGLKAGDVVLTQGMISLRPDVPVSPQFAAEAPAAEEQAGE
jgi:membrane fusion protein (multidrug efflux system)